VGFVSSGTVPRGLPPFNKAGLWRDKVTDGRDRISTNRVGRTQRSFINGRAAARLRAVAEGDREEPARESLAASDAASDEAGEA